MALIARIFVVIFAFLAACVAAAAVLMGGFLLPEWNDLMGAADIPGNTAVLIGLSAILISGFGLIPAMLLIAIAEGFRLRSVLFYGFAGGAIGLILYLGSDELYRAEQAVRESELFAASGIAAGLTYWALAGRKAGAWRAERAPSKAPAA
ncbi:MAG TPA: hypothetical protein VF913_14715 [Xanthobacteraceae bacterium]